MKNFAARIVGRLLLAVTLTAAGLQGAAAAKGASITFNLKDADINTVIATVAEVTGQNFIIDPRVKGKVTVISAKAMTSEEVYHTFLALLEVHNFAAVPVGNVIKIVPDVNAKQMGGKSMLTKPLSETDEIITRVIAIENVSATQLVPILRPLVPQQGHMAAYAPSNMLIISDRAANLQRILKIIERIDIAEGGSDIEVIKLEHASATEVVRILESLRRSKGKAPDPNASQPVIVADERTNSILVSGEKAERVSIRAIVSHLDTPLQVDSGNAQVIYLNYAKAKDLVPVLTGVSENIEKQKGGGQPKQAGIAKAPVSIQAHESTNALVIIAPPDIQRSLKTVIKQLDVRRAQVMVEAVIAEVLHDASANLGVTWFVDGSPGNSGPVMGSVFAGPTVNAPAAAAELTAGNLPTLGGPGAFLGLGRVNSPDLNAVATLSALAGKGKANVLSKPTILTLYNEEAEIVVGQTVPFLTGSFSSAGDTNNPNNPFQTIKRENVGITLKVTPQVNEGDAVKLDLEQKVDSVAPSSEAAADLITNTRSIKTTVLVDDGATIVLGGLIKDDLQETESKVPGLGDIPYLGALFRYKSSSKKKTNLMVFIRPSIVRDQAILTKVSSGKYSYIRAEQLKAREEGIAFMDDNVVPVLPEFTELPPPFDDSMDSAPITAPIEPMPEE